MEVKGMTPDQLASIVAAVSHVRYGDNVTVDWERGSPRLLNQAGTRFRGRVLARSSRGSGARRSWTGRRLTAACWHVFRDVIREALRQYPNAVFRTSMARYTAANFEATYPATGSINIGSMFQPVTMPELCACDGHRCDDAVPLPSIVDDHPLLSRIDAVAAMKPGVCGWCSKRTGSGAMMWCSEECQSEWHEKYAVN